MTKMLMTRRPGGRLALACAGLFAVTAPAAAQVTLNASSWVPPGHPIAATMLVPLCADFEKATSGRVKCNVLPKAPVGAVQTFDGVKDGLMDLSFIVNGYTPGRFALSDAPEFPFMGDTSEVTSVATYDKGEWSVIFKRSLTSTGGVSFAQGTFVPVAFSAWDGGGRERGNKRGLTQWASLYVEPQVVVSPVGPAIRTGLLILGLEILVIVLVRRSRKGTVPSFQKSPASS